MRHLTALPQSSAEGIALVSNRPRILKINYFYILYSEIFSRVDGSYKLMTHEMVRLNNKTTILEILILISWGKKSMNTLIK